MIERAVEITLHQQSRNVETVFADGMRLLRSCAFLLFHSSLAEARRQRQRIVFMRHSGGIGTNAGPGCFGIAFAGFNRRVLCARYRGRIFALVRHDQPTRSQKHG